MNSLSSELVPQRLHELVGPGRRNVDVEAVAAAIDAHDAECRIRHVERPAQAPAGERPPAGESTETRRMFAVCT
jgi:hypothetical protein